MKTIRENEYDLVFPVNKVYDRKLHLAQNTAGYLRNQALCARRLYTSFCDAILQWPTSGEEITIIFTKFYT